MKIPLQIDVEGGLCGLNCPFKRTWQQGNRKMAKCSLFDEELQPRYMYSSFEGFSRDWKCINMEGTKE